MAYDAEGEFMGIIECPDCRAHVQLRANVHRMPPDAAIAPHDRCDVQGDLDSLGFEIDSLVIVSNEEPS